MPIFREIEEGRVGKRPFLQPLTWFGRLVNEPEKQENFVNFRHIFLIYNTTQQKIKNKKSFEKNQRFLLNVGALSPNLFLDFSQHVRFLRYSSMNLPKTMKMLLLGGFGKIQQGISEN
jgi:hypothetical protein